MWNVSVQPHSTSNTAAATQERDTINPDSDALTNQNQSHEKQQNGSPSDVALDTTGTQQQVENDGQQQESIESRKERAKQKKHEMQVQWNKTHGKSGKKHYKKKKKENNRIHMLADGLRTLQTAVPFYEPEHISLLKYVLHLFHF